MAPKIKVPAQNLVIEDAKITFRNFAGNEGPFNAKGVRSFAIWLDDAAEAEALADMGWKIKYTKVREDGEPPRAYMPVAIKYHPKVTPPRVKMITSRGQTSLDEDALEVLDFADLKKVDMIVRPFYWDMPSGAEGVKTMLVSIYATIREDELELKYADVPQAIEGRQQLAIESDDVWEDLGEVAQNKAIEAGF